MSSRPNAKRALEAEIVFPRVALEKIIRMIIRNRVVTDFDPVASITSWVKGSLLDQCYSLAVITDEIPKLSIE